MGEFSPVCFNFKFQICSSKFVKIYIVLEFFFFYFLSFILYLSIVDL